MPVSSIVSQQHQSQNQSLKEISGQHAVDIECTRAFSEYATADDQVEAMERLNDAHIMEKIKNQHQIQEEEEVGPDPDKGGGGGGGDDDISTTGSVADSTIAADESEIIHTANQFLQLLAKQRSYVLRNKLPSSATVTLNTVEQIYLIAKLQDVENKQTYSAIGVLYRPFY